MSDNQETTAPEVKAPATELKTCPTCHRKLLTQTSILCNWCGAKIDDPEYLARAAEGRQALDQQEREQIEAVVQEEAKFGIFGRLKNRAKNKPSGKSLLE